MFINYELVFLIIMFYSINHEYKEWDEKNPQVTTCNQNTKNLVQGSTVPQEVDTDKEVVFTYDVTFKVCYLRILLLKFSVYLVVNGLYFNMPTSWLSETILGK